MLSILRWRDGRETTDSVTPGPQVLMRVDGVVVPFLRAGVERSMFVYVEQEGARTLAAVPGDVS